MDFIFTIITAAVIATSAGSASTTNHDGDAWGPPVPGVTEEQADPTSCDAPCIYDAQTDTYSCPCVISAD